MLPGHHDPTPSRSSLSFSSLFTLLSRVSLSLSLPQPTRPCNLSCCDGAPGCRVLRSSSASPLRVTSPLSFAEPLFVCRPKTVSCLLTSPSLLERDNRQSRAGLGYSSSKSLRPLPPSLPFT
ncbi:hypothetical protein HDK90DRAFT_57645 [Phyllosticta capitalensis]|uniref:Uncharacterized protein n=1 Tax=Phyllosticta capitalensis TaxID=121624 RepID=A0ABR1YEI9_9PEZI